MTALVLRLASTAQSWAGYRVSYTKTGTSPVPTKTGVAGLLGACLGVKDYLNLLDKFTLTIRVDKTNPVVSDLQVASPPKPPEKAAFARSITLAHAKPAKAPAQLTSTNLPSLANRDFIPHAEFIAIIEGEPDFIAELAAAINNPTYMPYLGRRANPPEFPFCLGTTTSSAAEILAELPRVPAHNEPAAVTGHDDDPGSSRSTGTPVRAYLIDGDYHSNDHHLVGTVNPPTGNRKDQLAWASSHLSR